MKVKKILMVHFESLLLLKKVVHNFIKCYNCISAQGKKWAVLRFCYNVEMNCSQRLKRQLVSCNLYLIDIVTKTSHYLNCNFVSFTKLSTTWHHTLADHLYILVFSQTKVAGIYYQWELLSFNYPKDFDSLLYKEYKPYLKKNVFLNKNYKINIVIK